MPQSPPSSLPLPPPLLAFLSPLPSFPLPRAGLGSPEQSCALATVPAPGAWSRRRTLVRAQADVTRLTGNLGLSFMALSKVQQPAVQGDPLWGPAPGQLDTQRQLADLAKAGRTSW